MTDSKCKLPPFCEYSKKKQKCIKPNPYVEYIAKCKRDNIKHDDCKKLYRLNKTQASEDACKNREERFKEKSPSKLPSNPDKALKELKSLEKKLLQQLKLLETERQLKIQEFNKTISTSKSKTSSKKHLTPVINNKSTLFLQDRIKNYKIFSKYINSRKKYSNNCLSIYKIINERPIYRIGNRIILTRQIGSDSVYGVVYYSYYRKKETDSFSENIVFATKLLDKSNHNNLEYLILEELTKYTINTGFIHFPLTYGLLKCGERNLSKYASEKNKSIKHISDIDKYMPKNIVNINNIYIILNELANGDLDNFVQLYYNNDEYISNILIQIFISLMFFYKTINAFHADAHNGNFLFHKIKPGGYIHYNIYGVDYYLKNLGFIFVIWDFGLIKPFYNSNIINNNKYGYFNNDFERITYDFETVINAFKNKNVGGWVDNKYPISTNITNMINDLYTLLHSYITYDVLKLPELNTALLTYLITNISSLLTRRPSNVINTNPYVLN